METVRDADTDAMED